MALYALTKIGVRNTITGQQIPSDRHNLDWQMYQNWLDIGNIPDAQPDLSHTIDQEWDLQSDWIKAMAQELGLNLVALKARVTINRK